MSGNNTDTIEKGEKRDLQSMDAVGKTTSVAEKIVSNWKGVVAFTVLLFLIFFAWDYFDPTIPDWVRTLAVGIAVMFIPGWLGAAVLVDWMISDDRQVVVELDAARKFKIAVYLVPQEKWDNRTAMEGGVYYNSDRVAIVRRFEKRDGDVYIVGPWMAERTDAQLATDYEQIKANRGRLREWAIAGHQYNARIENIVADVESIVYKHESDANLEALHGEDLAQKIRREVAQDSRIEQIADSVEHIETPDTPDEEMYETDSDASEPGEKAGDQQ